MIATIASIKGRYATHETLQPELHCVSNGATFSFMDPQWTLIAWYPSPVLDILIYSLYKWVQKSSGGPGSGGPMGVCDQFIHKSTGIAKASQTWCPASLKKKTGDVSPQQERLLALGGFL